MQGSPASFLVFLSPLLPLPPFLSPLSLCKPREKRTHGDPSAFSLHRHLSHGGQIWGGEETDRNRKTKDPLCVGRNRRPGGNNATMEGVPALPCCYGPTKQEASSTRLPLSPQSTSGSQGS